MDAVKRPARKPARQKPREVDPDYLSAEAEAYVDELSTKRTTTALLKRGMLFLLRKHRGETASPK